MSREPTLAILPELQARVKQAVKAYTAGGRQFEALDGEELERRFVLALETWCVDPTNRETGPALNELSCEYLMRQLPVPDEPLLERMSVFIPVEPMGVPGRPPVAIAVVILRESSPPGWPSVYVPHWGLLMDPRDDRYGDFFEKIKARRAAGPPS